MANKQQLTIRKDASVRDWLITLLKEGSNPSFRYNSSTELLSDIALQIEQSLVKDTNLAHILKIIHILIKNHDYRLVADYMYARHANKTVILNIFEQIIEANDSIEMNKLRYQLAYTCFLDVVACSAKADVSFTPCLNDVFLQSDRRIRIYLIDSSMKLSLIALLDDVGIELGTFIERQYDLPSFNALVRQGVVRTWALPDGKVIVSKRNNPQKPRRFCEEQLNYELIVCRMGGKLKLYLDQTMGERDIWLKIAQPFAVIWNGYSGCYYALARRIEGISLEDLLMKERDQAVRHKYLAHYRLILDALYDRGILWGDMSPRNIIVKQTEEDISYHIFDFEKTRVMDGPISIENRKDHCRGQICAEELCAICTLEEVQECFRDYFNPKDWDFESEDLRFPQRPEVADILHGRGIHKVTLGKYNQTEYEMMNVLIPDINPVTKERRFPSHLKFKVEHYLSCAGYDDARDYERKATEVLIAAKQHRCFDNIVALLTKVTDRVEGAFLKAEFEGILDGNSAEYIMPPQEAIKLLIHTIDAFYQLRKQKDDFLNLYIQWTLDREEGLS